MRISDWSSDVCSSDLVRKEGMREAAAGELPAVPPAGEVETAPATPRRSWLSSRRLLAYSFRETTELLRDPIRLAFALGGTALLMLVFGFGITFDIERLSYAAFDRDRTPESRHYLASFAGSRDRM